MPDLQHHLSQSFKKSFIIIAVAKLKVKLARNLRREILRGHPWVYKEALNGVPSVKQAQICQVVDGKGELAWAMYDPHGPLSLRILSTEKAPPTLTFFENQFQTAFQIRKSIKSNQTNSFRLFNGEGDLLPGLVCDIYNEIAVIQFDGQGPSEFWDREMIIRFLLKNLSVKSVLEKSRRGTDKTISKIAGVNCSTDVVIKENAALFKVDLDRGQKTGFFLDQRSNRNFVRTISKDKTVLNLFSYTGGFSIYSGLGGAKKVTSVDISKGAIQLSQESWELNGLKKFDHEGLAVDVFDYLKNNKANWDHIIVDPPSMSHSEAQRSTAKTKYIELFAAAARKVSRHGSLSLSSCSSHVTFEDFFDVITEALSLARRTARILKVSGQGIDHPFPHSCPELRYLKFVHLILN